MALGNRCPRDVVAATRSLVFEPGVQLRSPSPMTTQLILAGDPYSVLPPEWVGRIAFGTRSRCGDPRSLHPMHPLAYEAPGPSGAPPELCS